jgi:N6-L-threonylcarbamoyladenine synthase
MRDLMIVLGIETTCDETAAAVVERLEDGRGRILSNVVLSQVNEARCVRRGRAGDRGARPRRSARRLIADAMAQAGATMMRSMAIAAAAGPGLIGGVIVGLTTAKAIALVKTNR